MENATDALKMAFAIFVFVIALSTVFSLISKIKETAEIVISNTDKTVYYEWFKGEDEEGNLIKEGRTVGAETVTAAIYNCKKDLTYVTVKYKDENNEDKTIICSTVTEIEGYIDELIKKDCNFKERVVEVTTAGKYIIAEDGTKLTETPGKTKVYIIFEEII